MPWKEVSKMAARKEFVVLAGEGGGGFRELCRRFAVSPTTGYEWLGRYRSQGDTGLEDRSRRPHRSPNRTDGELEETVVRLRRKNSAWGARKLRRRLEDLGRKNLPASSTFHAILLRHGLIEPQESAKHRAWQRFEHEAPNELWQMDFKGHFPMSSSRCHALTVLDDHSRFAVGLQACGNEKAATVQERLTDIFRCYGLPDRMTMDNGSPWGSDAEHPHTPLTVWLMRLGIGVSHSRPFHPQTQGKDERFHRTLKLEVLRGATFRDLADVQNRFDAWRDTYNLQRPHQAIGMEVPARRYRVSARAFPKTLPPIQYSPGDIVRQTDSLGRLSFQGRRVKISRAVFGLPIAFRPTTVEPIFDVFFCAQKIAQIDLRDYPPS